MLVYSFAPEVASILEVALRETSLRSEQGSKSYGEYTGTLMLMSFAFNELEGHPNKEDKSGSCVYVRQFHNVLGQYQRSIVKQNQTILTVVSADHAGEPTVQHHPSTPVIFKDVADRGLKIHNSVPLHVIKGKLPSGAMVLYVYSGITMDVRVLINPDNANELDQVLAKTGVTGFSNKHQATHIERYLLATLFKLHRWN